jgi:hypothetical protein
VLGDTIVDAYVPLQTGKELWDALEARYGASDAGSELYVMEQFHDYRMVDDHSVVEQAHEIQALVKDLEMHGCELPDKFVAGCMIAKLPPSWTEFAASLKHKRREFNVTQLIGTLDVEDKARAKDVKGKKVAEGGSSTHVVQKNRPKPQKKKNQQDVKPRTLLLSRRRRRTRRRTRRRRKTMFTDFTCGKTGHFARDCPDAKWKPNQKKSVNMVEAEGGTSVYGNLLHTVLSVFNSPDWWIDTGSNIHVCADKSLFSSYQVGRATSLLMGNGAHPSVRGVGTVDLKLTSGKTVQLKNVQHVPSIRKSLISGSLLCCDGYKLVFESNKCVLSKFGTFIGKGYESGGLFLLSLCENNVKYVNHINNHDEANIWV